MLLRPVTIALTAAIITAGLIILSLAGSHTAPHPSQYPGAFSGYGYANAGTAAPKPPPKLPPLTYVECSTIRTC